MKPRLDFWAHFRKAEGFDAAPLNPPKSSRTWALGVALLLAGGLALRLLYLLTPDLDSDQAIFGLMARHMLHGELPIFQWGYSYMGTLESVVAAPLMVVFGPTRFALNLSPALFSLLFAYAAYRLASTAVGRRFGLWALAFACFPASYLVRNVVVARGAYSETLALGTLAGFLALRALEARDPRIERRLWLALGLALGISFWTHLNTVIYAEAIVLLCLIERPNVFVAALPWTVPAFVIGSAPFWIGTVQSHFGTFLVDTPPVPPLSFRAWSLVRYRLPIVSGIVSEGSQAPTAPLFSWSLLFIHSAALGLVAWSACSKQATPERRACRFIVLFTACFLVTYLASPFSGANTQRYLIPLYTVLVIAPALLIARISRLWPTAGIATGIALLVLQLVPTIRAATVLDRDSLDAYRSRSAREGRLLRALQELGLHAVYADDYWDGARLTFDAGEQVVFATPYADRNPAYLDAADGAPQPAFLFHFPESAAAFEGTLRLAGARHLQRVFEGHRLFYAFEPAVEHGPEVSVVDATASHNSMDAPLTFDHDAGTRWESMAAQEPGMWLKLDLGHEQPVAGVDLWPEFAAAFPRGLRVEVSSDGEVWKTVSEAKSCFGPCSWAAGRPVPTSDGWIVVRFPPQACRWIRLVELGRERFSWAIAEVKVYGPAEATAAPASNTLPAPKSGRLLADPVLAARIPNAVRHWQGNTIGRFEDLRDVSLIRPGDHLLVDKTDPLAARRADPDLGVTVGEVTPVDDHVVLGDLRLDADDLPRLRVTNWRYDPQAETAVVDLGGEIDAAGVIVEHREAASSFPRGLLARTSSDGVTWSDADRLVPRPPALIWTDEGLMGASLHERIFRFRNPRRARFIELAAAPRHPVFPWVVRRITVLESHAGERRAASLP